MYSFDLIFTFECKLTAFCVPMLLYFSVLYDFKWFCICIVFFPNFHVLSTKKKKTEDMETSKWNIKNVSIIIKLENPKKNAGNKRQTTKGRQQRGRQRRIQKKKPKKKKKNEGQTRNTKDMQGLGTRHRYEDETNKRWRKNLITASGKEGKKTKTGGGKQNKTHKERLPT